MTLLELVTEAVEKAAQIQDRPLSSVETPSDLGFVRAALWAAAAHLEQTQPREDVAAQLSLVEQRGYENGHKEGHDEAMGLIRDRVAAAREQGIREGQALVLHGNPAGP